MARTNNRLANQGVWIGAGPGTEDETSLFMPGQLGSVYVSAGKVYQKVQFKSTTSAIAAGTALGWTDPDDFVVSAEADDWNKNLPAGVALGTQTASKYGWIQVAGPHSAILQANATTTVAGDSLVLGTDGGTTRVAAGTASTYAPLAIATATGGATSVAGIICAPHNGW